MGKPVYIHYGSKKFNPKIGFPVKCNYSYNRIKPVGGLWASRVDDPDGWKDWCIRNDFRKCSEKNSFKFTLSDKAKIKYIEWDGDLDKEAWFDRYTLDIMNSIDYDMVLEEGYDGIEVTNIEPVYYTLYGWDCNSIVVLNPNVVEVVESKIKT